MPNSLKHKRTDAWDNLAEDWRTNTVPAGSELIHFQVNQTKKINFRCRKHEGAILGLLAGTGNRVPCDMGTNTNFIITDEDVELGPRWRTPEVLAWMSGKSMKAFSVKGYVLAYSGPC